MIFCYLLSLASQAKFTSTVVVLEFLYYSVANWRSSLFKTEFILTFVNFRNVKDFYFSLLCVTGCACMIQDSDF